jgi:hypothetical protein
VDIKTDTGTAVTILLNLFSKIFEKEEVTVQWKKGIVFNLPKRKLQG